MGKGDQVEPGVFEVGETREPTAEQISHDRHWHELVEKGLTPHTVRTTGPLGTTEQIWWDDNRRHNEWPMAVILIGFMTFVLLMTQGVPW